MEMKRTLQRGIKQRMKLKKCERWQVKEEVVIVAALLHRYPPPSSL